MQAGRGCEPLEEAPDLSLSEPATLKAFHHHFDRHLDVVSIYWHTLLQWGGGGGGGGGGGECCTGLVDLPRSSSNSSTVICGDVSIPQG